jgi:hypothetical protein
MPADHQKIHQRLKAFDFTGLFTQELMWNHFPTRPLDVPVDGITYTLKPVAQRGMAVFECVPPSDAQFPKYASRRKIDTHVSKTAREHIIIFHDHAKTVQVWQWVKREAGKPSACREQLFYRGQSGDALVQKIQGIAFDLEDEANVAETVAKVGAAFDVEKITKKFYELFQKEHDAFLTFTKGIPEDNLQRWYASVMLNRLMFIYFIQKKDLLGGDQHYLTSRLTESKKRGKNKFYREFLCPLFFEGFAKREEQRGTEMNILLGRVPYLNGGLFLKHEIELKSEHDRKPIVIEDSAFERIFNFFEQYDWHLDDRPTRTGREINPDVLGYVFEKYINQKEMGAYYTKEDITDYISKNTIIPALFDIARKSCKIAFEGKHSVWRLLETDPDRYILAALLKGMDKGLPQRVSAGLTDTSKRADWNKAADPAYSLPAETWRDVVARRTRCEAVRKKLAAGDIRSINDLITYNLDIHRFAEEVIANCEGPELLRALYEAIRNLSVLDPACGSGAFLFAALNILERLYDTCLVRMQAFVDDLDRSGEKHSPEKYSDFRETLEEMNDKTRHPSPRYFVLKSIILNNLYGIDIMEEGTEICKLRLFLKLVSQVDAGEKIEPLPDVDFNIRSGNTLVGFATEEHLGRVLGSRLDFDNTVADIRERAELAETAYDRFRDIQVRHGFSSDDFSAAKTDVQRRLSDLRQELDAYLSGDYGVRANDKAALRKWKDSHRPFHWFAEFFGLMKEGGFVVVLGNPPYKELRDVTEYLIRGLTTTDTKNLYAPMLERWLQLCAPGGRMGAIVPVSSISTEGYSSLQRIEFGLPLHVSSFDDRPSRLFDGLEHIRLSIHVVRNEKVAAPELFATECLRWTSDERAHLFSRIQYQRVEPSYLSASLPKISSTLEVSILNKVWADPQSVALQQSRYGEQVVYYSRKMASFLQVLDFVPKVFDGKGKLRPPSEFKDLRFPTAPEARVAFCVLNSTLFRWFINVFSDFRHINKREIEGFRCDLKRIFQESPSFWNNVAVALSERLQETSEMRRMKFKHDTLKVQCIIPKHAKDIIDKIDVQLANHYGLTSDELDFVVNYDFKYRVGMEGDDEAEEAAATTN